MKICWDNLERVRLSKEGNLKIGFSTYIEMVACEWCGEPYLAQKRKCISSFCSHSCVMSGKNNPFFGKRHSIENRKKMSEAAPDRKGPLSPSYKGGVKALGLTTYDTHKDTLGIYEEIRKQKGTEVLEVRCAYCGRWHAPIYDGVRHRLVATNSLDKGEARLYCSEYCKLACPIYGKIKYPKGFKHITSREVNPYLRQMVLKRDNWTCQICGKTVKEAQLHVHHMDPVAQNLMFQNDMDSCITLCKGCHKMVHSRRGCRYADLRCNKETDYTRKFKEEIRLKSINSQK